MAYEVPKHYRRRVRHMLKPLEDRVSARLVKNLTKEDLGQIAKNKDSQFSK